MPPQTISDTEFRRLITRRSRRILALARHVSRTEQPEQILMRPLLGELLSQAMQVEELLDRYDARNNCRWCAFRAITAALKLFSDVGYELLHIKHAVPAYRLLPIEADFVSASEEVLRFVAGVLQRASSELIRHAEILDIPLPKRGLSRELLGEPLPPGRLPRDCGARRPESVDEMVTLLATSFLNLAADSRDVRVAAVAKPDEYESYLKGAVREEGLRTLELRFHNLQSLYDTHVAGTEAEREDEQLLVLRGHISVVFHLLKTATVFAHYNERHYGRSSCLQASEVQRIVDRDELVGFLMRYSIMFTGLYITCAEQLCREMLKRYSEVGRVEVPIPRYRGFHVRPSTLISKLAAHYGSTITMWLRGESYDACKPLELFRANEKINAEKRRWLAMEIAQRNLVSERQDDEDFHSLVRRVVLSLAEAGKVIIYEQPLQFPETPVRSDGPLMERVIAEVTRMLALGKIDVDYELTVCFEGDTRVLADIQLLAEAGYGEDKFGNNIPLPEKLQYLRR